MGLMQSLEVFDVINPLVKYNNEFKLPYYSTIGRKDALYNSRFIGEML
jgi:hypothetical protein